VRADALPDEVVRHIAVEQAAQTGLLLPIQIALQAQHRVRRDDAGRRMAAMSVRRFVADATSR